MNRRRLTFVVTATAILLMVPQDGVAAGGTSSLSGRVVDLEGQPVAGFGCSLEPVHVEPIPSEIIPAEHDEFVVDSEHQPNISALETRTDEMGRFAIHNVPPKRFRFAPYTESDHGSVIDYEIVSMKVGAMTVLQHEPSPFGGIAFAIKADAHIENVEIKVRPRIHSRGRIVFADGTPLVSARISINVQLRSPDGTSNGSSSSSGKTDADGYFVFHADETAIYTVTVNYQGLSATAEPFWLVEGDNREDLVFTFDNGPISPEASDGRIEVSAEASTSALPAADGAWVVNAATGHAYKIIHCKSWDDANIQAAAEGAHLVTINDAAEQNWLAGIFGHRHYWIGLTDYATEGEWAWESGEPVTYTNWAPHEPEDDDWGNEDFVIMDFSGEWSDVGPNSVAWKMVRFAILETDSVTRTPSGER